MIRSSVPPTFPAAFKFTAPRLGPWREQAASVLKAATACQIQYHVKLRIGQHESCLYNHTSGFNVFANFIRVSHLVSHTEEEHRLKVFGLNADDVTGDWKKFRREEIHDL